LRVRSSRSTLRSAKASNVSPGRGRGSHSDGPHHILYGETRTKYNEGRLKYDRLAHGQGLTRVVRRVRDAGVRRARERGGVRPGGEAEPRAHALPHDLLGGAVWPPALRLHEVNGRPAGAAHAGARAVLVRAKPRAAEWVHLQAVSLPVSPVEVGLAAT
jgi:hypothetical protein